MLTCQVDQGDCRPRCRCAARHHGCQRQRAGAVRHHRRRADAQRPVQCQDAAPRRHRVEEFRYDRGPWEELRRGELAELERRLRSLLLRSARLEEPRVQAYLNRVLALPRLRRHAYAPIIAISPPTSRRRRLVRRVRPRRVPPLPPGVWRRASRRAVRCGQPACAGQWRHRYGSGERLCMLR